MSKDKFLVRFSPILVPIITGILFEVFYLFPKYFPYFFVIELFVLVYFVRQISLASEIDKKWWNFLFLPLYFTFGLASFIIIISNQTLIQILILMNVVFLYFYLTTTFNYLINPEKYKTGALQNFSSHGNFLSFYFIASSIFAFQTFLNISITKLIFFFILSVAIMTYQVIWANNIDKKKGGIYILISTIVLLELFWALSFLTLSYYILGVLMAVAYYTLIGLIRFYLLSNFDKSKVKLYLIFGTVSISIVLLTARWF